MNVMTVDGYHAKIEYDEEGRILAIGMLGIVAMILSLLLAFSSITVWEAYSGAESAAAASSPTAMSMPSFDAGMPTLAVVATTLSICAVFVPIAFMSGIIGRFFFQFGLTVTVAVLVSLFVSFTLDPMLSSVWHDPPGSRFKYLPWLGRFMAWIERGILAGEQPRDIHVGELDLERRPEGLADVQIRRLPKLTIAECAPKRLVLGDLLFPLGEGLLPRVVAGEQAGEIPGVGRRDFGSMPVGLFWPTTCSAQTCSTTTPAIINGRR